MYYVISLKHTNRKDKFITLWRPKNAGYTYAKESAGLYEEITEGYHNSEDNVPVPKVDLDKLFITTDECNVLLNSKFILDKIKSYIKTN